MIGDVRHFNPIKGWSAPAKILIIRKKSLDKRFVCMLALALELNKSGYFGKMEPAIRVHP